MRITLLLVTLLFFSWKGIAQEDGISTSVYSDVNKSTAKESAIDQVRIHPNPFKDKLLVEIPNAKKIEIKLYDVLGKKIIDETFYSKALDFSKLNSGIYFMKITTRYGTITRKVIKE